jgi:hypothetical protein
MMVNERHIEGEPNTGFEREEGKGPFDCGNCQYFHPLLGGMGGCSQTEMMIYSREPRLPESHRVLVHERDCCEYVERVGRKPENYMPEILGEIQTR